MLGVLLRCWECSNSVGEVVGVLYLGFRGAGSALVELVRCWECSSSVCEVLGVF